MQITALSVSAQRKEYEFYSVNLVILCGSQYAYCAPLPNKTTSAVCNKISKSRKMLKFFT